MADVAAFPVDVKVEIRTNPKLLQVKNTVEDLVQIAARNIETRAKRDSPYKTGATRNSIEAREAKELGMGKMAWRIGPTTHYAPFLEFGTRYMSARPFLIPAIEAEGPKLNKAIRQILALLGQY